MTDGDVLELMDQTMRELEVRLAYVEEQGWNLLVCAIGAEVQAFGLGRDMLAEMLEIGGESGGGPGTDKSGADLEGSELHHRRLSRDAGASILHDDSQEGSERAHSPVTEFTSTLQPRYAEGSGDDEPDDDMLGTLQS